MWLLSHVWLFATLLDCSPPGSCRWDFSGKYWSGLPYLPPGDLPNPEIKPESPVSPALQVDSLPSKTSGKPQKSSWNCSKGVFAGGFSYNLLDFYLIIQLLGVFFFFFNFSLVVPHSMWDLNSPTRDWSHTHCVEKWLSWTIREVLSGF